MQSSAATCSRAVDILLQSLGRCPDLTVITLAARTSVSATAYAHFIAHLDRWACDNDTQVMIVLDGQEGPIDTTGLADAQISQQRDGLPQRGALP